MSILINWLVSAIAIIISAYILPGVRVSDFGTALVLAVVLGILNAIVKPILVLLTLPINILTLGLFTFVINAVIILLASNFVTGFKVDGFLSALLFSLLVAIVSSFLHRLV